MMPLLEKEKLMLRRINRFYRKPEHQKTFLQKMVNNEDVSLSLIDWFITVYARHNQTVIDGAFIIHDEYKNALKSAQKCYFDVFCRSKNIEYEFSDGTCINTTLGQLNIGKWLIENGILSHIHKNASSLRENMSKSVHKRKGVTTKSIKRVPGKRSTIKKNKSNVPKNVKVPETAQTLKNIPSLVKGIMKAKTYSSTSITAVGSVPQTMNVRL
jgi:hypothetical protein